MKLSFAIAALAAVPFAVACGGTDDGAGADGDEVSEAEANIARVTPGSFALYAQPHFAPNPHCDVHTKLELSQTGGSKAHIEEAVGGECEIFVAPNPRDYKLRLADTDCGTRTYTGKVKKGADTWSIRLTDNRARTCENVIPALIVLEETHDSDLGPMMTTKYSNDAPPGDQELTVEGSLERVMGIGGESTGRAILTEGGAYELVLDLGEQNQFVDGKKARVKGTLTFLSGVETHNRRAIDVTSMLVCPNPTTINCMPGPNVRLSNLCSTDNRAWISANCDGVGYLD